MSRFLEGQWLHALLLAVLVAALVGISDLASFRAGSLWGAGSATWAWIAAGLAIAHQVWVTVCWRAELHARLLSRWLGSAGFVLHATVFSVLGIARIVSVYVLAAANRGTIDAFPATRRVAAVVAAALSVYLFYSVRRYFGLRRAFGIDHFDPAYRSLPRVREGIFRYTDNGMYVFGFLVLWVPGLWLGSFAALAVAAFMHLYIWVHYFATERPDMRRIYGSDGDGA